MYTRTSTNVITYNDLESQPVPTMRLTLPSARQGRVPVEGSGESWCTNLYKWCSNAQKEAEHVAELEQCCDPVITRMNQAKIDKMFDGMINDMNQQRQKVKNELITLPPHQQAQVLTFWSGVQEFMGKILGWLQDMFCKVLEKIKQGWQLIKDTVKSIFNRVFDAITNAFR
eukprot:Seg2363.5 transcript_id=Seg2363.5/GoldUCD/mRNA.D3Y31 product="hypothetical protein" protein_id=Seg2363.5/GoldUCD/D3Y31